MADFNQAYALTAKNEGGYNNLSWDNGGETYAGVSRRYWGNNPSYKEIFAIIDANKPLKYNQRINDPRLNSLIKTFYKNEFWDKQSNGSKIANQGLANFVYDFAVNSGYAEREINEALNKEFNLSLATGKGITADTLQYLNSFPGRSYTAIRQARIDYLKTLPDWDKAGAGWMNRIASYPFTVFEYITNNPATNKTKIITGAAAGLLLLSVAAYLYLRKK